MLVTCTSCQSVFKLADNDDPNIKMRCSICSNVFALKEARVLPDNTSLEEREESNFRLNSSFAKKTKTTKRGGLLSRLILIVFFIGIFLGGILWNFTPYLVSVKALFNRENIEAMEKQNKAVDDLIQRVRLLELINVRQFVVPNSENEKFDKLTIIEGQVINNFDEPRSFIELEATLYDAERNPLGEKTQMAGPKVSFFQLQVLGELELEQALRDNIAILNYNTNVEPNETVPFTFIFYNPPETAANYNIKIINAQIPEPEKPAEKPVETPNAK